MKKALFCAVLALVLTALPARGQWSDSSVLNTPVATFANDQEFPAAVSDGQGGVIIAWSDRRASTSNADIYIQRLDANGIPLWTAGGVLICDAPGVQDAVAITTDGADGAIVAWVDRRADGGDIYAQRVTPFGVPVWSANGVPVVTNGGTQSDPVITTDDASGAVVAWLDTRSGPPHVYAQRITATGSASWILNGVGVCTETGPRYDLTAVSDSIGGAFIAWADERSGGADVYVQNIDATGTALWDSGGVAAITFFELQYRPQLVRDGAGGVYVSWVDWRTTDTEVYLQRLSPSGALLWPADGLYIGDVIQGQYAVSADGAGGVLVTHTAGDLVSLNVYAVRIRPDGIAAWTPQNSLVSTADPLSLTVPLRMMGVDGGAVVLWQDSRNVPGSDLYAQRFDTTGVPLWDAAGVPVATAANFQGEQRLVPDGRGGVIVVFQDNRSGLDEDVYAQRVGADGTLPATTSVVTAPGWDLVSVPRLEASLHRDSLFPGNLGAFVFDGTIYASADTLIPGRGYWVRFPSEVLFEFGGTPVDSASITVPAGNSWVLVGGLSTRIPLSGVTTVPAGALLSGSLYSYTAGRYIRADVLLPGKAYWAFATQPCTITLRHP